MKPDFHFFDSFNARHSSFEEIAETFVSNEDFARIAKNNHSFILGPRGCGKTTMLKMLTKQAQQSWKPQKEEDINLKEKLPFIAIYIPSDELWKDQLKSITNPLIGHKYDIMRFVTNALLNLNIISNFCVNIKQNILVLNPEDAETKEYIFSKKIIKLLSLEDCIASISEIRLSIEMRKNDLLNSIKSFLFELKQGKVSEVKFADYYHTEFLDTIRQAIIIFEMVYYESKEQKWALCFDELELLSETFISVLISKLRVTPTNIVFKLSSGPLTEFTNSKAQVFHDFEVVKMWPFSYKEETRYMNFCKEIALVRLKKSGINDIGDSFESIFGELDYTEILSGEIDKKDIIIEKGYGENSFSWHLFKKLSLLDDSFKIILQNYAVDVENPIAKIPLYNDTFFRKTKELVINRLFFNNYKEGKFHSYKTRKEYSIYYGAETILKICEGNPRFIINIVNELLSKTNNDVTDLNSPELQSIVIKSISNRFKAMLNTYPTAVYFQNREIDLKWLLDKVGNYFEYEINSASFKVNPANSFIIKNNKTIISKEVLKLLQVGVGLGAFVKLDITSDDIVVSKDTRYRLSYLLHPTYKLPLRLYSSVNLNKIVSKNKENEQKNLFETYEN